MTTHNANNERIKRCYFSYLKEAKRHSEPTVDAVAKALDRFEVDTKHRDFRAFHFEQAVAFKKHLTEQRSQQSGEKLSKATLHATLAHLKRFFQWLAGQPGSHLPIRHNPTPSSTVSKPLLFSRQCNFTCLLPSDRIH